MSPDYPRILEESLTDSPGDVTTLEVIALFHHLSGEDEKGIEAANKALAYDNTSFGALKVLSEIYVEQDNHEMTIQFVRRDIEHFKNDEIPLPLKMFSNLIKRLSIVSSKFQKVAERTKQNLEANKEWLTWAHSYVSWYEEMVNQRK
ncbi:MAG TPA: hypothetical protein DD636_04390 [Anaerolineaceae bacterium]|nr:hypothetical protein [Anaerolineaceae bacterium]